MSEFAKATEADIAVARAQGCFWLNAEPSESDVRIAANGIAEHLQDARAEVWRLREQVRVLRDACLFRMGNGIARCMLCGKTNIRGRYDDDVISETDAVEHNSNCALATAPEVEP